MEWSGAAPSARRALRRQPPPARGPPAPFGTATPCSSSPGARPPAGTAPRACTAAGCGGSPAGPAPAARTARPRTPSATPEPALQAPHQPQRWGTLLAAAAAPAAAVAACRAHAMARSKGQWVRARLLQRSERQWPSEVLPSAEALRQLALLDGLVHLASGKRGNERTITKRKEARAGEKRGSGKEHAGSIPLSCTNHLSGVQRISFMMGVRIIPAPAQFEQLPALRLAKKLLEARQGHLGQLSDSLHAQLLWI